jgi:microcystin-dependent protein
MATTWIGQIDLVAFNFAPMGWALCQGQLLPISQNTALFSLIGTYYGGNGTSTFALPNLQGLMPIHQGAGAGLPTYVIGQAGGLANVTLLMQQMAGHNHSHVGTTAMASSSSPGGLTFGEGDRRDPLAYYTPAPGSTPAVMNPAALTLTGNSQPHPNMMPYLTMNYIIALQGEFPPRS